MEGINLDEDWDPDKYDKEMESVFNDDYYAEGDEEKSEWGIDDQEELKKPDLHLEEIFDEDELPEEMAEMDKEMEEDDALLNDEGNSEGEPSGHVSGEDNLTEDETPEDTEEAKQARKEAEKLMDELYQLDYEDMIGSMPVRFHYTKVKPLSYGLSTEEIMKADDKDLRQFVSMKKLAPYRDHDWRVSKEKVGKFKSLLQKKLKREEEEEKQSRKEQKKNRKREKKEFEKKMKEKEERKAAKKRSRKRKN